jgi:hypothetical protein
VWCGREERAAAPVAILRGLHLLMGDGVNIVAQLEGIAAPGGHLSLRDGLLAGEVTAHLEVSDLRPNVAQEHRGSGATVSLGVGVLASLLRCPLSGYGTGSRMPIKVTRALLTAALDGSLRNVEFRTDKYFGFAVPTALPGVPSEILNPVNTWKDKDEFDKTARALVAMFQKNFAKFEASVDADVRAAAPEVKLAAE